MKYGLFKIFALVSVLPLAVVLNACGDDSSTSSPAAKLPTEVKDLKELEEHKCDMSVIGEKVFVESEDLLYECDGDVWFKSYDQTKPSSTSTKSSSSTKVDGDDGDDEDYSSNSEKNSSSSVAPSDVEDGKDKSSSSVKGDSSSDGEDGDLSSSSRDNVNSSGTDLSSSSVASSSSVKSSGSIASSSSVSVVDPATVVTGTLTDDRDGQVYKTVTIGTQTWMAENLNYAYTSDPYKYDSKYGSYTSDSTSWCYDDDPSNCDKYGRLYTWATSMDSIGTWSTNGIGCGYGSTCSPTYPVRGICPTGWHLPTKAEFETLFTAVGGSFQAAKKLKSTSGWVAAGKATDAYGFSALPAGARDNKGAFCSPDQYAYFWSATEFRDYAYNVFLYSNNEFAYLKYNYKYDGFSVRCLKDSE